MSTMTPQDEISVRLAEFSPVYEEIGKLLKELAKLQQAELAQAEYIQQTSGLDEEIRALTKRQKELEALQQKTPGEVIRTKPFVPASGKPGPAPKPPLPNPPQPIRQQPIQRARIELKKLVMRWGYIWKLSGDTRGRINRIADDPSRPLGEALALLDWTAYQNRIGSDENDEAHLVRVNSWGDALVEYRERLRGETDMLKTRYRLVMPILDAWIERNTDSGRQSWDKQIAETNAAKEKDVERLRNEIDRLTARG